MEQRQPSYLKSLRILFLALLLGQNFLLLISFLLLGKTNLISADASLKNIFLIVIIVLSTGSISAGFFIARKKLQAISPQTCLTDKLNIYRFAFLTRCATAEFPGFLSIIFFMLTGNYLFIGIWLVIALIYFTNYPSLDKISNTLELTQEEKQVL